MRFLLGVATALVTAAVANQALAADAGRVAWESDYRAPSQATR